MHSLLFSRARSSKRRERFAKWFPIKGLQQYHSWSPVPTLRIAHSFSQWNKNSHTRAPYHFRPHEGEEFAITVCANSIHRELPRSHSLLYYPINRLLLLFCFACKFPWRRAAACNWRPSCLLSLSLAAQNEERKRGKEDLSNFPAIISQTRLSKRSPRYRVYTHVYVRAIHWTGRIRPSVFRVASARQID